MTLYRHSTLSLLPAALLGAALSRLLPWRASNS
jgi:hypothetical protein